MRRTPVRLTYRYFSTEPLAASSTVKELPLAIRTSRDTRTPDLVRRFPNLGKFAQKNSQKKHIKSLDQIKLNSSASHPETFYKQPKWLHMINMVQKREMMSHKFAYRKDVVYDKHCQVGDIIELTMFTSLKKQKVQIISGLIVKRERSSWQTRITIRNSDPDGLVVMRTYQLFSPWICGLKIKKRYKVQCKDLSQVMMDPKFTNPEIFDEYTNIIPKEDKLREKEIMEEDLWW